MNVQELETRLQELKKAKIDNRNKTKVYDLLTIKDRDIRENSFEPLPGMLLNSSGDQNGYDIYILDNYDSASPRAKEHVKNIITHKKQDNDSKNRIFIIITSNKISNDSIYVDVI